MSKRWKLLLVATIAVTALAVVDSTLAETRPGAYGEDPCTTAAYDMARSTKVYDSDAQHYRMAMIGCDYDDYTGNTAVNFGKYSHGCDAAAYRFAQHWLAQGKAVLRLTVGIVGRAIASGGKYGVSGHDCTWSQDWFWS